MDVLKQINYKGFDISICRDESPTSPDTWGNEDCFLVYDHRQFCVRVKGFDPTDIYEHCRDANLFFYNGYYVFPVYAYIHSGVSLSLGRGTDRWDTSMKGYALIKRMKGWTYRKSQALKVAESVVEEWNDYLSGNVYGYDWDYGGCWGFYGDEGMKDAQSEAEAEIDDYIERKTKEKLLQHFRQLKIWIKHRVPLYVRRSLDIQIY